MQTKMGERHDLSDDSDTEDLRTLIVLEIIEKRPRPGQC